jgi:Flp pilus assembly protein TadD
MRRARPFAIAVACLAVLSACEKSDETDVSRAIQSVNAIDENNLSDIMLTAADPQEAVAYFTRSVRENPERLDLRRNLALSLVRARRPIDALPIWEKVIDHPQATPEDSVGYADALIRVGRWDEAEAALDDVPPTFESYKRYRLEAMVADSNREWANADSFYKTAAGMTAKPSGVLNNWGYSKLTRGDFREAERLFVSAIQHDPSLFTSKNNLVLARAAQRNYQLPIVEMTQVERAQLLHTAGLSAIKQGDVNLGKGLLQEAIDTHPQHFESAVRALRALENTVTN